METGREQDRKLAQLPYTNQAIADLVYLTEADDHASQDTHGNEAPRTASPTSSSPDLLTLLCLLRLRMLRFRHSRYTYCPQSDGPVRRSSGVSSLPFHPRRDRSQRFPQNLARQERPQNFARRLPHDCTDSPLSSHRPAGTHTRGRNFRKCSIDAVSGTDDILAERITETGPASPWLALRLAIKAQQGKIWFFRRRSFT